MGRLKDLQESLNNLEPFSPQEDRQLDNRSKTFIRDIQIVNRVNKNEALKIFANNKNKSSNALKHLGKTIRTKLKKYLSQSPTKGGTTNFNNKKFTTPKKQQGTKHHKGSTNAGVKKYLTDPTHQKDKTYPRVLRQSYLHPKADLYEAQHGINSKASREYRARRQLRAGK